MNTCPEFPVLEGRPWSSEVKKHVANCGSCRLVMELIDERSQAAASRERRTECVRFEALIAVRVAGELRGPASVLLDEHIRDCGDCRAIADTLAPSDDVAADHSTLTSIDPSAYALGAEVARGGMGRIVAARDLRIGRPVAVKELLSKTTTQAARFEREARVTARLQHPGIVPIYEIGKWQSGTPFYAMRMVAGRTLRSALASRETLDARLALLPSVIAAAEAVAFAHAHQVIHRDLTPANIMVGDYGETVVIDWGLAKDLAHDSDDEADAGPYRRDPDASADLTAEGAIIGTAAYMPPEQARGKRVDTRADVYALGAILYHLLAGQAPFKGNSNDVLQRVTSERPPSLPSSTPPDLASIATKAMAASPDDRYPSAKELAAELTAFQAGRLVGAHEYTRGDLIRRWARKRRGVLAVAAIAIVALAVFGAFAVNRIVDERDDADQQRVVAEVQRAQSQALSTTLLVEQGRQEVLAGRHERAAALLSEAYRADPGDVVIRQLLGPTLRTLEASERLQPPRLTGPVDLEGARIEVSPDGAHYVVRLDRLWLSETRVGAPMIELGDREAAEWPHFSADGRYVAGASGKTVRVWEAATGRRLHEIVLDRPVNWAGFSRDNQHVIVLTDNGGWGTWATASGTRVRFVESIDKGTRARPASNHASAIVDELFPVAMDDGKVTVWDRERGVPIQRFDHGGRLGSPFSTGFDGTTLITCGLDSKIKRWNARTGELLATMIESTGAVMTCALSSTGRIASSSVTGGLRVWTDAVATVSIETEPSIVRFSPDGHRLLIQHGMRRDTSMRDAATGTLVAQLGLSGILSIDRERVFLVRPDRSVEVVRLGDFGFAREIPDYARATIKEMDRDARRLLTDGNDGRLIIRDLETGRDTPLPITKPCAISDDGNHVVGWGERGITIVNADGKIEHEIPVGQAPYRLAISSDHRRVVSKLVTGKVTVWDVGTGREIAALDKDTHDVVGLDHGWVLLWTQMGAMDVWDPVTGKQVAIGEAVWQVQISDDGRWIWYSDGDHVTVIETRTGARKLTVLGTFAAVDQAGSVFVRAGDEVSQWSTTTRTKTRTFTVNGGVTATKIVTNPSGSLIATSSGVWETGAGRQIAAFERGAPSIHPGGEHAMQTKLDEVRFSATGDELRIQTSNGSRIWNIGAETRTPGEVSTIVERSQPWRVIDGRLTLPRASAPQTVSWLKGRALYHGAPVAGAKVVEAAPTHAQLATTDQSGRFEIPRPPGKLAVLVISERHGAFGNAELTAGEHPTAVDVALTLEGSIAGRVIDRSGRPHASAYVVAEAGDDTGDSSTDPDGKFRITMLSGSKSYGLKVIDRRTGTPIPTVAPLPHPLVASPITHVEGIEIVVEDDPVIAAGSLDRSVFHRLATRWQPTRALDLVNEGAESSKLVFNPSGSFHGQLWRLSPVGAGYRLTTLWLGEARHLGLDGDRPALVKDGNQTWLLERRPDGAYRIKPAGDLRCLAGGVRIALIACAETAEQSWLITPTTARTQ